MTATMRLDSTSPKRGSALSPKSPGSPSSPMSPTSPFGQKSTTRAWSAPSLRDWAQDWDGDVVLAAAPRFSFGESGRAELYTDGVVKRKTRITYLDIASRQKAYVPGPGAYRSLRLGDAEPPKDAGHVDKTFSLGRLRDRKIPTGLVGHSERQASHTTLKKVDEKNRILLPSSFQTPGPGAYTAYTSFGSPSGGTRKRFLASNKADNVGRARSAEKFHRHSER
ncbi:Hypothetical protein SCF082_LOCUS13576 [Durusdinium trenchii]|uniref:Uncharacterized protein n=1 Tax=Durusdinium trenchii TaxID=1381693 RepID=A0ABP0JSG4_9DINO